MKNFGKLAIAVTALIIIVAAIVILIKLITGVFAIAGRILNTILGIVIIIALILIVVWMFNYAKKK